MEDFLNIKDSCFRNEMDTAPPSSMIWQRVIEQISKAQHHPTAHSNKHTIFIHMFVIYNMYYTYVFIHMYIDR